MSIAFSEATNNTGLVQQVRDNLRVDSTQWPTSKIVNSANNWLDFIAGYLIGSDKRFQWDDTNHTKLPEGTAQLTINTTDYSWLTDEQGNRILTLIGISVLTDGLYKPLTLVDRNDQSVDRSTFGTQTGVPTEYDQIADNIIRLNYKPSATVAAGIKFFFQRAPSYLAATDTTKVPGVPPLLHRGFVVAATYDGALALGLDSLKGWAAERDREEQRVIDHYLAGRNNDTIRRMVPSNHSCK